MNQSSQIRSKLRQLNIIVAVGISLGIVFVLFSDGFQNIFYFINGAIIGLFIGLFAGIMELFVFKSIFIRTKFYITFLVRLVFYSTLVFVVTFTEMVLSRMIRDNTTFYSAMNSEDFQQLLHSGEFFIANVYILSTILIFNFIRQLNRKLGHGVLMNFITGRFYNPIYRLRIILFMRIMHSDEIIEKIGRLRFHQFFKEVIIDISEPILRNKGVIYEYVEDEVVITWSYAKGTENAHCVRTFFEAGAILCELKEKYYRKFGFTPKVKAALNAGKVVRGEIGDVKCQVALTGDLMNTTARIMNLCVECEKDILITSKLSERIQIPVLYSLESFGNVKVKGKKQPVELMSLKETELVNR